MYLSKALLHQPSLTVILSFLQLAKEMDKIAVRPSGALLGHATRAGQVSTVLQMS